MTKSLAAVFAVAALLAGAAAQAQSPAPAASSGTGQLPPVRHLVYRFGYNTKATKEGTGTGTTTIDIGAMASDGGIMVTATDDWWNTVQPRQSYTCEVYPNGGITCAQPPYAVSPIQIAIMPLLGQSYFMALTQSPTAAWKQNYNVKATFFPSAASGFAGQVYTWNCAYALTGKGTVSNNGSPLTVVAATGTMKQQGGRYITVNQQATIAYDPRIQVPVLVDEALTFVPRLTVNQYTIQLRLIRT